MEIPIDFPQNENKLKDLVQHGRDYALAHGIMLRREDGTLDFHKSFSLFPSPVPKSCFYKAMEVQTIFNLLTHRVAHDYDFLTYCLQSTNEIDEFSQNLWNVYCEVRKSGIAQPLSLGMNRSDYMICAKEDKSGFAIKQIEFNTIAAGSGGHAQRMYKLHKYILSVAGKEEKLEQLPENKASDGLAESLIKAWSYYNKTGSVILFLTLDRERYIYDQRFLEYDVVKKNMKCKIIRRTLQDMQERASLGGEKQLLIDDFEVAVVYFRSGYDPSHFRNKKDWDIRLLIEKSRAIKCPSIPYQLAGTKKVQQVLAEPGVLERFLEDKKDIDLIRSTQAGLYSLDLNASGDRNAEMAIQEPIKFVMKPQREGGGNNIFNDEVASLLTKLRGCKERSAYILMERIHPIRFNNFIVRHGEKVELEELTGELSAFGSFIGTPDEVLHNQQHGYLARTKPSDSEEGGLLMGTGAHDGVYLV